MSTEFSYDPATGQRGAGFPAPGAHNPTAFNGPGYVWNPSQYPSDPLEEPYHAIPFEPGPLPENIQAGAVLGLDVGDAPAAGPIPSNIVV
jgi:hypothetical protein